MLISAHTMVVVEYGVPIYAVELTLESISHVYAFRHLLIDGEIRLRRYKDFHQLEEFPVTNAHTHNMKVQTLCRIQKFLAYKLSVLCFNFAAAERNPSPEALRLYTASSKAVQDIVRKINRKGSK